MHKGDQEWVLLEMQNRQSKTVHLRASLQQRMQEIGLSLPVPEWSHQPNYLCSWKSHSSWSPSALDYHLLAAHGGTQQGLQKPSHLTRFVSSLTCSSTASVFVNNLLKILREDVGASRECAASCQGNEPDSALAGSSRITHRAHFHQLTSNTAKDSSAGVTPLPTHTVGAARGQGPR